MINCTRPIVSYSDSPCIFTFGIYTVFCGIFPFRKWYHFSKGSLKEMQCTCYTAPTEQSTLVNLAQFGFIS